jgi:hypothetical protein
MSNERFRIKKILMRHGGGYRLYPFSMGELINSAGVVLGAGLIPDNDSCYQFAPGKSDTDGVPEMSDNLIVDPPWLYNNTCPSGVLLEKGQFY